MQEFLHKLMAKKNISRHKKTSGITFFLSGIRLKNKNMKLKA